LVPNEGIGSWLSNDARSMRPCAQAPPKFVPRKVLPMNHARIILLFAAASTSVLASPVLACDTRHFYNHSDVTFTIQFEGGPFLGSCSYGNSGNVASCDIPPGETGELHYSDAVNFLVISSPVYNSGWTVGPLSCNLNHSGNTGNIVVNEPAAGDIQTCGRRSGGNYDCAK
jgi:hypothetical protein